jgi:hypothetical protein
MKRIGMLMLLCGMAALILGGCAVPLGEDFTIPRDIEEEKDFFIADYNLQAYVPVPVTGEQAVKRIAQRGDLEGTVTWKNEAGEELPNLGTFERATVYRATIELTPRQNFLFDPSMVFGYHEGKIDQQEQQEVEAGNSTRTITVLYNNSDDGKITYITDYNLQNYVPFPVTDQDPVRNIDVEGIRGTVIWKTGGVELNSTDKFQTGVVYTADISLEAQAGYKFSPKRDFFYTPGTVATPPDSNRDEEQRDLSMVTYNIPMAPVPPIELLPYFPVPQEGDAPVTVNTPITTPAEYNVDSVSWNPNHSAFRGGEAYTATVVLTAKPGYAFVNNNITHDSKSVTYKNNTGFSVTVEVRFPITHVTVTVTGDY